jgi:saccharopine dehydrogenase-like NADP-dependent oxidoreductase
MKNILLFGAGKSATVLIDYLLNNAAKENWHVYVVDANQQLAASKIGGSSHGTALSFDIADAEARAGYVAKSSLVISMLPAALHSLVATECLAQGKHLLTASYVDPAIRAHEKDIAAKGLIFLCEMGLDPGIDHMSAMQLIAAIRNQGGTIHSFLSHCGGLVAPESDDNPWHYKISWNPRNIVLAGKAGAVYRENGKETHTGYNELFANRRQVPVTNQGNWGWYANRDSLSYAPLYGLEDASTFIRTTLRHPDFMEGWEQVIHLGLTAETPVYNTEGRSLQELFRHHLTEHNLSEQYQQLTADAKSVAARQLSFLAFDEPLPLSRPQYSPADLLQEVLETKLALQPADKDMIIMLHEIGYELAGEKKEVRSCLVVKGEDHLRTAMAKTVGLPLGIAAKLILDGTLTIRGLHIPVIEDIYEPVLKELATLGVAFTEEHL